jgi:hypothetical protein
MSIRLGIFGISGFGGGEAMRLVASHPSFELIYAASEGSAGSRLVDRFPGVPAKLAELVIEKWYPVTLPKLDVLFASLPTGASAEALARVPRDVKIVDIGGDHRYVEGWAYGLADVWPAQIEGQTRFRASARALITTLRGWSVNVTTSKPPRAGSRRLSPEPLHRCVLLSNHRFRHESLAAYQKCKAASPLPPPALAHALIAAGNESLAVCTTGPCFALSMSGRRPKQFRSDMLYMRRPFFASRTSVSIIRKVIAGAAPMPSAPQGVQ